MAIANGLVHFVLGYCIGWLMLVALAALLCYCVR